VRIGWQIPLATQGQIVQVLKHTNLLEKHGLSGKFVPFSYGGPQSEAALAGELDVIFVGDQPVINLIARGGKWKIVSRLFYTKTAIMVPLGSPAERIGDLRGKIVASPFGSVAHREAILKEQAAGLDADKDVKNINLDILEIANVVQAGGEKAWGKIDAVGVWEPSTSLFESKKLARILDYTRTLGVVAMSDQFISEHREAAVQFLASVLEAWAYFAAHTDQANHWYIDDARLAYTPDVLAMAASVEPNYSAKSLAEIDLSLTGEHIATLEKGAAWGFERNFTKTKAAMRPAVNEELLLEAERQARSSPFNPQALKVKP
jgi:ABC-type nitrate/sulfonate/bicarbonate transport system substrate-binding protein